MKSIWVDSFFSSPNKLTLDILEHQKPELKQLMQPLLDRAFAGEALQVLPWTNGKQWWFYACCKDGKVLRELQRLLKARLGSVYSYSEVLLIPRPNNLTEEVLLQHFKDGVLRLEMFPISADQQVKMQNALKQVVYGIADTLTLLDRRPPILSTIKRPVGQILRNLLTTLVNQDDFGSLQYLDELRLSGGVSHQNLILIELQRLGYLGNWQLLLEHSKLETLMRGRLPNALVEWLLLALKNTAIDKYHDENDRAVLKAKLTQFEPLFRRVPILARDESHKPIWLTWGCGASLLGETGWPNILHDEQLISEVFAITGQELKPQSSPLAEQVSQPESLSDIVKLLNTGSENLTPKQLQLVLEKIPESLLRQLQQAIPIKGQLESLNEDLNAQVGGWSRWLDDLESNPSENLLQQLTKHFQQWPIESYDPNRLLGVIISNLSSQQNSLLRNMLPMWLLWTQKHQLYSQGELLVRFLELLALDDIVHTEDLTLCQQLFEHLLQGQLTKSEYVRGIEAYQLLFEKNRSIVAIERVTEFVEWLLDEVELAPESVTNLWQDLQSLAISKWRRLGCDVTDVLRLLAEDICGTADSFPSDVLDDEVEVDAIPDLSGKSLAIYSLTEGATRRAKVMLEARYAGLHVEVNHDHSATSKLLNLAKKADYFLFVAASAKHQAFYPVSEIRNDLIYTQGKGTTSIIRAFISKLKDGII
ncbi:protein DpdD [Shewanella xiamenensis]|uniref:Protein DpdD n=1 Tax=Shewanella xiamenensis TaxID=332186 RepID=A0AAE4TN56_9GAMM|nr:protein DpdD [Shewanella xiamenensis]MCT8862419.1 hypothetical protein [Shewanella xiamenensis]MDH1316268.1 protein DpdD [Shewanella xiamenensis]MDV5390009.1 protein DpdD [Shewanella xiamenensis]